MPSLVVVKKGMFRDSITLMKLSKQISEQKNVKQAAIVMATSLNKRYLEDIGFRDDDLKKAGPNDLVIAAEAISEESLNAALQEVERLLSTQAAIEAKESRPSTLEDALEIMPDANLVVISVPGEFAKREAMKALKRGLNVFLFSSNVSIEEEIELKKFAWERQLLVMGPDCGTAFINNVVLGFGNVVNRGEVGIVSASGTGLQQVSTLIHNAGFGVSHAIGTGSNDLAEKVGGLMMKRGIKLLEEDEETRVVALISKPPSASIARKILKIAESSSKPTVINFLGAKFESKGKKWYGTSTLEDAAEAVCAILRNKKPRSIIFTKSKEEVTSTASSEFTHFSDNQKYIRGIFSGGTLCYEAMIVLSPLLGAIHSNVSIETKMKLENVNKSVEHTFIDMGSEEFTVGRAHPMIDFTLTKMRILQETRDPEVAVILIDIVLGYGAHSDPADEIIPVIIKAKSLAKESGRYLSFVASVVGTEKDPQNAIEQCIRLQKAGVIVMPSNAQAARMAALIATRNKIIKQLFKEKLR